MVPCDVGVLDYYYLVVLRESGYQICSGSSVARTVGSNTGSEEREENSDPVFCKLDERYGYDSVMKKRNIDVDMNVDVLYVEHSIGLVMIMDFSVAAPKLFVSDLAKALPLPSVFCIGGLRFKRAWVQGVLVAGACDRLFLDDGSGIVELLFHKDVHKDTKRQMKSGMYVLVVGACIRSADEIPAITVHKIVDLSSSPDAEALWNLEAIEAYHLFYKSQIAAA